MVRISAVGIAAVAVIAVIGLLLGLLNFMRGSFALNWAEHGSEENASLRYQVQVLTEKAEGMDGAIQALRHDLEQMRGDLKLAMEALEKAGKAP